jgi:hypothetical protein
MSPVLGVKQVWPVVLMEVGEIIIAATVRILELNVLQQVNID